MMLTDAPTPGATHNAAVRWRGVMRITLPFNTPFKMVEFIFNTQFAVGQFHLKINGIEQTVSHLTGFSDESKRRLFEKTLQILDENSVGAGIDIEAEWKKVCPYF